MLAGLYARGFTHIRLPVGAERRMEDFSSRGDVARQLTELDFAIDTLTHLGFGVTIDIHPADRFARLHVAEPDRALGLLEALWRLLARRYAGVAPDRLFFETLNEPTVSRKIWKDQGPRLVEAIRREAPNRTIIFGHADYQRIDALEGLAPLADAHVVYAAHFYDPMIFTLQGSTGVMIRFDICATCRFRPFGRPAVARLLGELAKAGRDDATRWSSRRCGNHGPRTASMPRSPAPGPGPSANGGPSSSTSSVSSAGRQRLPDRARWLQTVRRAAERRCIGWT